MNRDRSQTIEASRTPTPEEVDAILREAKAMRAQAFKDTFGALSRALFGAADADAAKTPRRVAKTARAA